MFYVSFFLETGQVDENLAICQNICASFRGKSVRRSPRRFEVRGQIKFAMSSSVTIIIYDGLSGNSYLAVLFLDPSFKLRTSGLDSMCQLAIN